MNIVASVDKTRLIPLLGTLLLSTLVLIGARPAPAIADEGIPQGIFSLGQSGQPISSDILAHPHVKGVSVRQQWPDLEPSEGAYDWSYLDSQIARAAKAGKMVLLRTTLGGYNTPEWVMRAGVRTFSFVNPNPYHGTHGQTVTIPLFWDPTFLEKKKQTIAALGRRFADNPTVVLVVASCANAMTDDWSVPHGPADVSAWLAAGYTSAKLVSACRQIIDATMAAFPKKIVLMAVGANSKKLDPGANYVARTVVDYARAQYPGRFVVQKNSLSAQTPDPAGTAPIGSWQVLFENRVAVGGQMLWYVSDDLTCRMNGKVKPCHPVTVLEESVRRGARYGMRYQEIYQRDLRNPDLAPVIAYAADVLSTPTTPLGVTGTASGSKVTLGWWPSRDDIGVAHYAIYRDGVRIATTPTTRYVDLTVRVNTTYSYRVTAVDAVGNESPRSRAVTLRAKAS